MNDWDKDPNWHKKFKQILDSWRLEIIFQDLPWSNVKKALAKSLSLVLQRVVLAYNTRWSW